MIVFSLAQRTNHKQSGCHSFSAALALFIVVSSLIVMRWPASAASAQIVDNGTPVVLNNCEAFSEKVVLTASGKVVPFGKLSPFDMDDRNKTSYAMHLGTAFFNKATLDATAVRVVFAGEDSFGDHAADATITYTGTFSPNALIERTATGALETFDNAWQGDVAIVKCSVDAVSFSNGTVWKASLESASSAQTIAPPDLINLPCVESKYVEILNDIASDFKAKRYYTADGTSSTFIGKLQASCLTTATGHDLSVAKLEEADAHAWRALALEGEGRKIDALNEVSVALSMDQALSIDMDLTADQRSLVQKTVEVLTLKQKVMSEIK